MIRRYDSSSVEVVCVVRVGWESPRVVRNDRKEDSASVCTEVENKGKIDVVCVKVAVGANDKPVELSEWSEVVVVSSGEAEWSVEVGERILSHDWSIFHASGTELTFGSKGTKKWSIGEYKVVAKICVDEVVVSPG